VVSANTLLNLAIIGVIVGAGFLIFRNAGAIGGFIGGGVNQFGQQLLGGFAGLGSQIENLFTNTSDEQIVNTLGLQDQVIGVPPGGGFGGVSALGIGRLTFAQFLKDTNLGGKINLTTGFFQNKFTSQSLDFTINKQTGNIFTGAVGLSSATLAKQVELSQEFGIPTFDVAGNLSTFGGVTTGKNNG